MTRRHGSGWRWTRSRAGIIGASICYSSPIVYFDPDGENPIYGLGEGIGIYNEMNDDEEGIRWENVHAESRRYGYNGLVFGPEFTENLIESSIKGMLTSGSKLFGIGTNIFAKFIGS